MSTIKTKSISNRHIYHVLPRFKPSTVKCFFNQQLNGNVERERERDGQ